MIRSTLGIKVGNNGGVRDGGRGRMDEMKGWLWGQRERIEHHSFVIKEMEKGIAIRKRADWTGFEVKEQENICV